MHRFLAALLFCLSALASHPVRADVTGARVVSIGEMDKGAPKAPQDGAARTGIEGRPGIRFGMELVPEGSPQGAPVVLEARLKRPGDPEDAPPMRWLVAARIGIPVLSVWEFAYDWEVEPGVWTMTVSHEDAVLATASFMVVQPDPQAQAQTPVPPQPAPKPSRQAEPRQDKKSPDNASARPQTAKPDAAPDASRQDSARTDSLKPAPPRQDASPPAARKQPEPAGSPQGSKPDRPPKPLADVQGPWRASSNDPVATSGKRVQVLVAGVYSEEARALWVAAFLQKRGVKACVRAESRSGKKRWTLVAGWRDTPEEARRAKDELAPTVGEIVIVSMSAAELEKGLQCR